MSSNITRRKFFRWTGAGGAALQMSAAAQNEPQPAKQAVLADTLPGSELNRKLRVVFVGAHVDDWIDCAGTIARYTKAGHERFYRCPVALNGFDRHLCF